MNNEDKIERTISKLKDEAGMLYGHNFKINKEHVIHDENGNSLDLKEIIFGEFYANEMILYSKNSEDRFLLAYEGITKLSA
jgi:hypothetical protein